MTEGDRIIRASWLGTGAFAVTAVGAAITPALTVPAFIVAIGLFVVGTGVFIGALAVAAGRSRQHEIGMGGLFFLQGAAPRRVQLQLMGSLAAECVTGLATAASHPYTSLAFGILTPVYGLGLAGLWGGRYGQFGPRQRVTRPGRRDGRRVGE